jgi:DNA-binding beta-propeller fold protein YncE
VSQRDPSVLGARAALLAFGLAVAALLPACGNSGNAAVAAAKAGGAQSSAPLARSANDSVLVAVNSESDSISVFSQPGGDLTRVAEIQVQKDPRSIALSANGKRAFVACSESGTVEVVDVPRRLIVKSIAVGREPRAIVLSPNQDRAYVANAASNSITEIDTRRLSVVRTVDVPETVGLQPRALMVTSDGDLDDADEKLYAACYFGSPRPGRTGLDEAQDDQREGRIAVFSTADLAPLAAATLAPLGDSGFNSNGSVLDFVGTVNGAGGVNAADPANPAANVHPTPAFPNQLASLALHPTNGMCYVVSTGASPNGPFVFNSNAQGLVSVLDTRTDVEVVSPDLSNVIHQRAPLNLDRGLNQDTATQPVFFHTVPTGIAWTPDGSEAWICIQNSDVLVRMVVDANGIPTINAPVTSGVSSIDRVDLENAGGGLACKAPQGLVIDGAGERAFVLGFVSRSISVVDLATGAIVDTEQSAALPAAGTPEEQIHLGTELFFAGRGPDGRMSAASWGACAVCHPDGLTDGLTWMFDAGPRQTIPLDGMFDRGNLADQRILNWSAVRDENHDFELNTRGVFGGRGLVDDDRVVFGWGGASNGADLADALGYQSFTNVLGAGNDLAGLAALPLLPSARRDFAAATLQDGRVLIVGGRAGAGDGALVAGPGSVLLFDPRANTLVARSSVGFTPRHSLGAAALKTGGAFKVYAVGGYAATAAATAPTSLVEEYDVVADTWRAVASLPAAAAEFGITTTGPLNKGEPIGRMHVVGGNLGSLQTPVVTGAIHVFTPDANVGSWKTLAFGVTPRRNLGACGVVRGVFPYSVFALGGRDGTGTALTTVEAYVGTTSQVVPTDPIALVGTPLTQLPAARHSFAVGGANNRVYLLGGIDAAGAELASTLELNPGTNPVGGVAGAPGVPSGVFTAKVNLPGPRHGFQISSPTPVQNFEPVASRGRDARQDAINLWIQHQVRPLQARNDANAPLVAEGRTLFGTFGLTGVANVSCASCHGGAKWTRSIVDYVAPPSPDLARGAQEVAGAELRKTAAQPGTLAENGVLVDVGTFDATRLHEVRVNPADVGARIVALGANGFNVPSLVGVGTSAPYYHDGVAPTLDAVLNGSFDGLGASTLRTIHRVLDANDRAALIEFLESIDDQAPRFQ